jgi:flavorubredoxin
MFKVTNGIYAVGVLNPNMRIFDIVMRTDYGTSYNTYIIKDKKNVLIDGCHERFTNAFIKNIEEIVPIEKIDYLIVNHCEPDHTGALKTLLTKAPNIEIFCTASSKIFLTNILKLPLKIHVIKDREALNVGSNTLEFFVAPFLHWPDSMFTYIKETKTVFTCDFLGCHYCEPLMIDTQISYLPAYQKAVGEYYGAIFGPFPSYVKKGLEIIKSLDVSCVCTSHGPILTKNGMFSYVCDYYDKHCSLNPTKLSIPIFYASAYGYTAQIAKAIQSGIMQANKSIECQLYDINAYPLAELASILNKAKAFCIGSPTLNKNVVPPIACLINNIDVINAKNKKALVFGDYG